MQQVRYVWILCAAAAFAADRPWPINGWPTATPEQQGMSSAVLDRADAWIREKSPNRYSFLVVRNGYLVYERYYGGTGPNSATHIASISKSFLSALTGIAIQQGVLSLEDRWFDAFPEYLAAADPRTTDLRLRHMLNMTTGLDWSDDDIRGLWYTYPERYPDWILFTLTRNVHAMAGESFWYNTGNTHMLSALLTRKTGLTTYEFARRNLLEPIGITMGDWWRDFSPYHYYTGGFGMHMTARDLARFGYMYLREGAWNGRQVVPAGWVEASVAPQIRHNRGSLELYGDFYGYLWWMDNVHGFFVPSARGMGVQRIWYSRELDLVVVSTGDYEGTSPETARLVWDYVIPSLYLSAPVVRTVTNISPGSFATVYGENLSPAAVDWGSVILDGKTAPVELGGVKVTVAGQPAWLSYVGPEQVDFLVPPDVPAGFAEVEVSHPGGSAKLSCTVAGAPAP
jgi:CubicO group peptidase (beta-lactamase class C family)